MDNPTILCKLSKTGSVILWQIYWDNKSWWTEHGQKDGAMVMTKPTFVEQKNVGKANETSLEEQVKKEVSAKIKKQLESGYSYLNKGLTIPIFNVTLAHEYTKRKELNKLQFPYIAQPKLDGIRCYIKWSDEKGEPVMFTRNHKPITSCPHIIRMAKAILQENPYMLLDGELYNHELKNDFNKICSLVRKQKLTEEELQEVESTIHFCCFDVYIRAAEHCLDSYVQRNDIFRNSILQKICAYVGDKNKFLPDKSEERKAFEDDLKPLRVVGQKLFTIQELADMVYALPDPSIYCVMDGIHVNNENDVEVALQHFINEGFEGVMLKRDTTYQLNRTTDLLKYKRFKDAEYTIVAFEDGKGNASGVAVKVICKDSSGQTFKAGVTGNEEYRKQLYENTNDYVGKLATIKYQELTPIKDGKGGVPRFGKMMSIRDYE